MICDESCVVFSTMNKARFAATQEWQANDVQARRLDDAAVVLQHAFAIQHRNVQPGVVGSKTGGPENRAYAVIIEIQA